MVKTTKIHKILGFFFDDFFLKKINPQKKAQN